MGQLTYHRCSAHPQGQTQTLMKFEVVARPPSHQRHLHHPVCELKSFEACTCWRHDLVLAVINAKQRLNEWKVSFEYLEIMIQLQAEHTSVTLAAEAGSYYCSMWNMQGKWPQVRQTAQASTQPQHQQQPRVPAQKIIQDPQNADN